MTKSPAERDGYLTGSLAIIVNLGLFALKFWAAILSNSVAVMADAWHTLSDSLSSIVVIVGLWLSRKPADKSHPYGHGRIESIASIIVGVFLAIIAVEFAGEAIQRYFTQETATYSWFVLSIVAFSVLVKEIMAKISLRVGRKHSLTSLIADGWHHRSDALSSVAVVLGGIVANHFWWADSLLGIAIAGILLKAAADIIIESSGSLIGQGPSEDLLIDLHRVVDACQCQVKSIHHIHYHDYGLHKELTMHICLESDTPLNIAHTITEKIEAALLRVLGIHATLHVDVYDPRIDYSAYG